MGGGSGIFMRLIFIVIETDESFNYDYENENISKKQRINIKTLGCVSLGDRYDGDLIYENGYLKIGKDRGWYSKRPETRDKYIKIK